MTTTFVHGGLVVTPDGKHHADVLIDGERIVALLEPGSTVLGSDLKGTADQVVDATGKYLIPGGIDAHTHMQMPFGGAEASDTFATGTEAAAWGGTTTIVDFAIQKPGERVLDALESWHAKAAGQCAVDYGFHQIVGGVDEAALKSLEALVAEGVTSVKLFMAYPGVFYSDDAQILKTMQRNAELGVLTMMHAENGIAIDELVRQALAQGRTDPVHHGLTRPWQFEEEATHRAIRLAEVARAPLYVVHVSARQAMARIAEARSAGQNVFGETCPHYLWLSLEEQLGAPGFDGAKWVCSTPLRPRAQGHQDGLWQHLRAGEVTAVATDHCPFCLSQKELGIGDFSKIPNGIGSVEHRIDLIYQGVASGKITAEQWVRVCSTEPARMFGLYPRKGVIAPGSDADLVVYDPNGRTSIGMGKSHHMNMDYSAYEGWEIEGKVDTVLSRGSVVVADGAFLGRAGHGKYLKRGHAQNLV